MNRGEQATTPDSKTQPSSIFIDASQSTTLLTRLKKSYSHKSIDPPKIKFKGYTNKNLVLPKKLQVDSSNKDLKSDKKAENSKKLVQQGVIGCMKKSGSQNLN